MASANSVPLPNFKSPLFLSVNNYQLILQPETPSVQRIDTSQRNYAVFKVLANGVDEH
ncbi:hypothetical protein [Nostoc sp.]|uniref:hypothetical protein n=1 Tax=Nostoc sp. TaxID=1180 RepID=UPI002FF975FB